MLHRIIFALSLIVSFGIAQVGAITHELSHYNNATSQSKSQDSLPHNQVCEKCIGYAELGHAVNTPDSQLPQIAYSHYYLACYSADFSYTKPSTYLARAPPSLV